MSLIFLGSDLGHDGGAEMSRREKILERSDDLLFHAGTVSFVCDYSQHFTLLDNLPNISTKARLNTSRSIRPAIFAEKRRFAASDRAISRCRIRFGNIDKWWLQKGLFNQ